MAGEPIHDVEAAESVIVRPVSPVDAPAYVAHLDRALAASGHDGAPHFHPFATGEPWRPDDLAERLVERWSTPASAANWERAWCLEARGEIIGHLYLRGPARLKAERHRASLGMGLERLWWGKGHGGMLLKAGLSWARRAPQLSWVDLDVFVANAAASRLYRRHGFEEVGRIRDRFRLGDTVIDEVHMTLAVGDDG